MARTETTKRGVMPLALRDRNALLAAYMPFLKNGGIFIATDKLFDLGYEVFVLLTLMDDPQRYAFYGKVVWITPRGALGGRKQGIGVEFSGNEGVMVQKKIETYLAGVMQSDRPTDTM